MSGVTTPLSAHTFMACLETNVLLLGYAMSSLKYSVFKAETKSI